jgi:hypothetical protein
VSWWLYHPAAPSGGCLPLGVRLTNAPPAGPWQEPDLPKLLLTKWDLDPTCHMRFKAGYWPFGAHGSDTEHAANVRPFYGVLCRSAGSACPKAQVLN